MLEVPSISHSSLNFQMIKELMIIRIEMSCSDLPLSLVFNQTPPELPKLTSTSQSANGVKYSTERELMVVSIKQLQEPSKSKVILGTSSFTLEEVISFQSRTRHPLMLQLLSIFNKCRLRSMSFQTHKISTPLASTTMMMVRLSIVLTPTLTRSIMYSQEHQLQLR